MTEAELLMYRRQGRRRLLALMPAARAEARRSTGDAKLEFLSGIAKSMRPFLTEDNLEALVVYPGARGGWVSDLILRQVPVGMANAFGTPVGKPYRTQAEAEAAGRGLLVVALVAAAEPRPVDLKEVADPDVTFELYGWSIKIPARIVAVALEKFPEMEGKYTPEEAGEQIEFRLAELGVPPGGFTGPDFDTWDREKQLQLLACLCTCLASNLFRYPPTQPKPPAGRDEPEVARSQP